MKKMLLVVMLCFLLSSCTVSIEPPHVADPNDKDPYCGEGYIYQDGKCISSNDQVDYETLKDTMLIYKILFLESDDFKNTMFESEVNYYTQFFTSSRSYHIELNELINYNVEDVIFQGASKRVDLMIEALSALISLDKPDENKLYVFDTFSVSYDITESNIYLNIKQDSTQLDGHYRLSQNELNGLVFDALEESQSDIFLTKVIDYIYYNQSNDYHELSYVIDGSTQHFFQYDYEFSNNTVKTFLVSTMPKYNHFDIARAERYFNDDYYVVYSKGSNYEHKYFTLFNDGHTSINVNHVIQNPEPNHVPRYDIQWNLLDVEGWLYVENDRIYNNETSIEITPFNTSNFSYFGPEITLYDSAYEISADLINQPKEIFAYNAYNIEDFSIPMERLDELQSMIDVDQSTYIELNEIKYFADGFYDRFLNYITEDYLGKIVDLSS